MAKYEFKTVNYVNESNSDDLAGYLEKEGYLVGILEGKKIKDQKSFIKQAVSAFGLETTPQTWKSFSDYFWQIVAKEVEQTNIAVVWTDAHKMQQADSAEMPAAIETITAVSDLVVEQGKKLQLFLVGKGDQFPTL